MKRVLIVFLLMLLLTSCRPTTYEVASKNEVNGFTIYQKVMTNNTCQAFWTDVFYSGEDYNYGFGFSACSFQKTVFIMYNNEYVYLRDALEQKLITIEALLPELDELERIPEEILSSEADYYWLDFHIDGRVVYAYAGGECDQNGSETFIINDITYSYNADGCLGEHILYMRVDGLNIPIADLISDGTVDANYLIPLLKPE